MENCDKNILPPVQNDGKKIKVGVIGLGTVGSGVFKTLRDFENIEVVKIAVKNINKPRNIDGLDVSIITDDPYEVVNNPDVDIVAELIGGVEPAFDLIKTAIKNGKHIVTANKELLAKHGEELFNFAEKYNRVVLYEAAIAGGIPIIMPVKTILAGNKITKIEAILNGTTNYILTKMDVQGASYSDVLKEAQELGYAETDPTGDVEGFDAAYKITTLATIAFKKRIKLENVYREGITKIRAQDMQAANDLGYKIKLIASAYLDKEGRADVRVHPMLVSKKSTLAHIDYVTNAVSLSGHPVGDITLSGPGAGEFPTASAVMGDVIDVMRDIRYNCTGRISCTCYRDTPVKPFAEAENQFVLRMKVENRPGVLASIAGVLGAHQVSISKVVQKIITDGAAELVIVTDAVKEMAFGNALEDLKELEITREIGNVIREY